MEEYTDEEVRTIVDAILDEEMPEFQQTAWIMTNFLRECQPKFLSLPRK